MMYKNRKKVMSKWRIAIWNSNGVMLINICMNIFVSLYRKKKSSLEVCIYYLVYLVLFVCLFQNRADNIKRKFICSNILCVGQVVQRIAP